VPPKTDTHSDDRRLLSSPMSRPSCRVCFWPWTSLFFTYLLSGSVHSYAFCQNHHPLSPSTPKPSFPRTLWCEKTLTLLGSLSPPASLVVFSQLYLVFPHSLQVGVEFWWGVFFFFLGFLCVCGPVGGGFFLCLWSVIVWGFGSPSGWFFFFFSFLADDIRRLFFSSSRPWSHFSRSPPEETPTISCRGNFFSWYEGQFLASDAWAKSGSGCSLFSRSPFFSERMTTSLCSYLWLVSFWLYRLI